MSFGTYLKSYLKQEKKTYESFGAEIGVSGTSVYRYTTDERFPIPKVIKRIVDVTKGKISLATVYGLKQPKRKR